jgi:hypothetical protein
MENITFEISELDEDTPNPPIIPLTKTSVIRGELARYTVPVYYKYRFTFQPDDSLDYQKAQVRNIIREMKKQDYILGNRYIASIEHYSVGMSSAKPHTHIHFMSRAKSDTIRKQLAREFEMIGRVQCCKAEVNVDEAKFWRYPLKQQQGPSKIYTLFEGFEQQEINRMCDIAYEMWKVAAEVSVAKRERVEETNTLKDRLFIYLDTLTLITRYDVISAALMYYVEKENHPVNNQTIDGYVNLYMLQKKMVSYENYIKQNFKYLGIL